MDPYGIGKGKGDAHFWGPPPAPGMPAPAYPVGPPANPYGGAYDGGGIYGGGDALFGDAAPDFGHGGLADAAPAVHPGVHGYGKGPEQPIPPAIIQMMQGQQDILARLAAAQQVPVHGGGKGGHRSAKLIQPILPHPKGNWKEFERLIDEFLALAEEQQASEYLIVKTLKDALTTTSSTIGETISDRWSVAEMQQPGALQALKDYLHGQFSPKQFDKRDELVLRFDQYRRKSADMVSYIQDLEHMWHLLNAVGVPYSEEQKRTLLLAKADLPDDIEKDMKKALKRLCRQQGTNDYTYKMLKDELEDLDGRPGLFVKKVNVIGDRGVVPDGEQRALAVNAIGNNEPCRDFQRGRCNRGDGCRFAHSSASVRGQSVPRPQQRGYSRPRDRDTQRDRTTSPRWSDQRGRGYSGQRGRDFSRSRSPRGQNSRVCRHYQNGHCNFGNSCRFEHASSRRDSPRRDSPRRFSGSPRAATRESPRRDSPRRFSGSRNPGFGDRVAQAQGARMDPQRVTPPRGAGRGSGGRSQSGGRGDQRGRDARRSPNRH